MMPSLIELHGEMLRIQDEKMKNYLWSIQDGFNKKIIGDLKKAKLIPEDSDPKLYFELQHKYRWFFFMEPEWYWGPQFTYGETYLIYLLGEKCKKASKAGEALRKKIIGGNR